MFQDPIIREIRKIRRETESACGDDPQRYYDHLQQVQAQDRNRLVRRKPRPAPKAVGMK